MLHGLRARALAASGDTDGATQSIETAASIHGQLAPGEADDYMWGFPARQMLWYQSRTFTLTGDTGRADEARTEALRQYPATDQVDRVLLHLDGATCAIQSGEPDRAAVTAVEILRTIPRQRRTSVVSQRTDELAGSLAPYASTAAIREFNEFRTD